MNTTLERIPEKIGNLEILLTPEVSWPRLEKNKLSLPESPAEFYPLLGGTQFIARFREIRHSARSQDADIFFFGIDDSPFLSMVSKEKFKAFKFFGEAAFYEELKPKPIRLLSKDNPHPLLRQGDIWAIKVADSWNGSGIVTAFHSVNFNLLSKRPAKDESVLDSRHELAGEILFPAHIILERKMKK